MPVMRKLIFCSALLAGCASNSPQPLIRHAEIPAPPMSEYQPTCYNIAGPARFHHSGGTGYPRAALRAGYVDGWVIVQHDIVNGKTRNAAVVATSTPLFDAAALQAVANMEYAEAVSINQCFTRFGFRME